MARYTVGQVYPFIHCKFMFTRTQNMVERSLYKPWDPEHKLQNLEVVALTCVRHEKVPSVHDPEGKKECDGFVFAELNPDGTTKNFWYNQYPMAGYGQLDDSADRMVELDYQTAGLTAKQAVDKEFTDPKFKFLMHDARSYLSNIRRGQVTIAKSPHWPEADKEDAVLALKAFEKKVQDLIEKAVGKKLKMMQVMYAPAADGGEPVLMDWFEVLFDDDPEFHLDQPSWEEGRGRRHLVKPVEVKL